MTTKKTVSAKADAESKCSGCECGKNCKCKDCKCDGCDCRSCRQANSSYLPVSVFIVLITAVLITLVFSVGVILNIVESKDYVNLDYRGRFTSEYNKAELDTNNFIRITGGGVIDFFNQKQTGYIYISSGDCTECIEFGKRLEKEAETRNIDNIYDFYIPATNSISDDDRNGLSFVGEATDLPKLIYVKNGVIFDRLDDPKSESNLSTFLNKCN